MRFLAFLFAALFAVIFPATALAATAAQGYTIDFGPLWQSVIGLMATVATVGGAWALNQLAALVRSKTGMDLLAKESELRRLLNEAMENGISYAIQKSEKVEWTKVQTRDRLVAEASAYVLRAVPDTLAFFKLDEQSIKDRLLARLNKFDEQPGIWQK